MSIVVTSNSDKKVETTSVAAAETSEADKKSVSAQNEQDETSEDSEASENLEESQDESADEADESDEEDKSKEDKPKGKGRGVQKRINKLNSKVSERDQRIAVLEARLAEKEKPALKEDLAPVKSSQEGRPKADDFNTHEDYVEALTDWKFEQKEKDKTVKDQQAQAKSEYQKMNEAHSNRIAEFKKTQTDYDAVVNDFIEEHGDELNISLSLDSEIKSSNLGPAIVYELFKNPDELMRLNRLGPVALAKEIVKLEMKLEKSSDSSKDEKAIKSKAPAPITPVGSKSGSVKKSIFDKDISQAEYEALRAKQRRRA